MQVRGPFVQWLSLLSELDLVCLLFRKWDKKYYAEIELVPADRQMERDGDGIGSEERIEETVQSFPWGEQGRSTVDGYCSS